MKRPLDDSAIRAEAIRRAQRKYWQRGCQVGDTVVHPSDPRTFIVEEIGGGVAVVRLSSPSEDGGKPVRRRFPIGELYNPQVARDEEFGVVAERVFKLKP